MPRAVRNQHTDNDNILNGTDDELERLEEVLASHQHAIPINPTINDYIAVRRYTPYAT